MAGYSPILELGGDPLTPREKVDVRSIALAAMTEMRRSGESYEMCARWISERVNAALASSGDHAELIGVLRAADALEAIIAENAALREKADASEAHWKAYARARVAEAQHAENFQLTRATEAERKLAEAVGLLGKIAEHKPFGDGSEYRTDYQIGHDNAGSYAADLARSFLSKEAERG